MFNLGFVGGGCRGRSEICCRLVCENSVDGLVWEGGRGGPTLIPVRKFPSKVSALMDIFVSSKIRPLRG